MKSRITFFALVFLIALSNTPLAWGQADQTKRLIRRSKKGRQGRLVHCLGRFKMLELLTKRFEQTYPFIKPKRFDL